MSKSHTGVIVVLSYPDTVVRPAYSEWSSKLWPKLGIGGEHGVQAGHAALLLIEKKSSTVSYFDFGRYITTEGFGRVRSKESDVELAIPYKAEFKNDQLDNIQELLLWLEAHPEKTHGEGRLVASVHYSVDYDKALTYVQHLSAEKEVPYGAFVKQGSNCARFVTDTLIHGTVNKKVKRRLKQSYLITPSPVGNAIKAVESQEIYVVHQQKIERYENNSILKEYVKCFFNKVPQVPNLIGTEFPNAEKFNPSTGTWLNGIGSGAWFVIDDFVGNKYTISRYNQFGEKDFQGVFVSDDQLLIEEDYEFKHPSNCSEVYVAQEGKLILMQNVSLKQ